MRNKTPVLTLLLSFLLLLSACGGGDESFTKNESIQNDPKGKLVSAKAIQIKQPSVGKYTVTGYKIVYVTTDVNNNKIKASGLLLIPDKDSSEKSPLLSYQHGTNFMDKNVPSNNPSVIPELAGRGFIVTAPDYIGYGVSLSETRTYIHAQSYVNAGIDMLRASKAFLKTKKININEQLFLAGYSEGGYATLALQKGIQEQFDNEFTVTASAPGAGPYDLITTAKIISKKDINDSPAFMSFVIKSYNDIYNMKAIEEMYNPQYVDAIKTVFDGKHTGSEIKQQLTTNTSLLFKDDRILLSALQSGDTKHTLLGRFNENNIYNWKPKAPTHFFHAEYDEVVPYENSTVTMQAMQTLGAENISFSKCELGFIGRHVTCVPFYLVDTVKFFLNYDPEL